MATEQAKYKVLRDDLLYPELSFRINGAVFDVYNEIGGGHSEKYLQKAAAVSLANRGLSFVQEKYVPLKFQNEVIGKYFLDFLVEKVVVLELKRGRYLPPHVINQAKQYLESLDLELAIIACFAHDAVIIKRVVNHEKLKRLGNKFVNSHHS